MLLHQGETDYMLKPTVPVKSDHRQLRSDMEHHPTVSWPALRRAHSWPQMASELAPSLACHQPQLLPFILQIDYAPREEVAPSVWRWRRRHSERLTRRHPVSGKTEPLCAGTTTTDESPSTAPPPKEMGKTEADLAGGTSMAGVVRDPAPAANAGVSRPVVIVGQQSAAMPKRLAHGRSQSATVPASVTAAAARAAAGPAAAPSAGWQRLVQAASSWSRPPNRPASEALPSPAEREQLGLVPGSLPFRGSHGEHHPSFVESGGGHSLVYGLDGYFPKPREGQSLAEFLGSHEFKRNVAELDRENAHFRISESLIAAFEMVGSEMRMLSTSGRKPHSLRPRSPAAAIQGLHRQICSQRAEQQPTLSDTSGSPSSCSGVSEPDLMEYTSENSPFEDISSDPPIAAYKRMQPSAPVSIQCDRGLMPARSLPCSDSGSATRSATAENTALSLLSRFPEKQLPKASDLVWLVGEDQVPQSLLPMPGVDAGRVEASEKDTEIDPSAVTLRGTAEWAPPRAQIIFSIHKQGKRSAAMARQAYRCAGCGLKVSPALVSKFRWCEYLGRYFCTGCHTNQQFYIPARIIHRHDYSMYPVSVFSHQLLVSIWRDPLFHVNAINPSVLNQADLHQCRVLRRRLSSAQKYVATCRFAKQLLRAHPLPDQYIMDEIDLYSLRDLVEAHNRTLTNDLQKKYSAYLEHCRLCQLCCGRAFHCQSCQHQQVLFPFEVPEVRQCAGCGACYHYLCFPEVAGCARCRRLQLRRRAAETERL